MPAAKCWLKGGYCPWATGSKCLEGGHRQCARLVEKRAKAVTFSGLKMSHPVIDSLMLLVRRVGALPRCQGDQDASGQQAEVRAVVFTYWVFPQKVCGVAPVGGKWVSYLALCEASGLRFAVPLLAVSADAGVQQCRADPGDPLKRVGKAPHSPCTRTGMCMVD